MQSWEWQVAYPAADEPHPGPEPAEFPVDWVVKALRAGRVDEILAHAQVAGKYAPPAESSEDDSDGLWWDRWQPSTATPGDPWRLAAIAAATLWFAQDNLTGPLRSSQPWSEVRSDGARRKVVAALEYSGERLSPHLSSLPVLVLLQKLHHTADSEEEKEKGRLPSEAIWRVRFYGLLARALSGVADEVVSPLRQAAQRVNELLADSKVPAAVRTQAHLECAAAFMAFSTGSVDRLSLHSIRESAREALEAAQQASGLTFEMTGVLGRRTRYQSFDVALLMVDAKGGGDILRADGGGASSSSEVPRVMDNPDDLLLENPALASGAGEAVAALGGAALHPLEQLILLHTGNLRYMAGPSSTLSVEQAQALVSRAQRDPSNWLVYTYGLYLKSRLESTSRHLADRALMQMRELVDQFMGAEGPLSERLVFAFASDLPLHLEMQRELGHVYLRMGAAVSAMEFFERLNMRMEVIRCLQVMQKHERAAQLTEDELARNPTPELWCTLGDLTNNPVAYQRAWDLSGERYARAQRSLGFYYVSKASWAEAAAAFEKALRVNAVHSSAWFSMGSAYMRLANWEAARGAFSRVTQLEPDSSDAWANMASCSIRLGDKLAAFFALARAVRINFESPKVWYNFYIVCLDVGEFANAIQAQRRLVELGERELDDYLLGILVRVVEENVKDRHGKPGSEYRAAVVALFKFLESHVTLPAAVYECYSRLLAVSNESPAEILEAMNREIRGLMALDSWKSDPDAFDALADILVRHLKLVPADDSKALFSARLRIKSVLRQAEEVLADRPRFAELQIAANSK